MSDDISPADILKNSAQPTSIQLEGPFDYLKPGDIVHRYMYGLVHTVTVESVDDELVHAVGGWTFDVQTGLEEDPEIGIGKTTGIFSTWLIKEDSPLMKTAKVIQFSLGED